MKLLGWMHRKFRQNSNEPFKDFIIGHSCYCLSGQSALDEELNYPKPNFGTKNVKQTHNKDNNYNRKSFAGSEAARTENDEYEEESMFDLFHGFLTIGTLGSEQVATTDPSETPSFAFYVENITEKDDEVTENELKLINYELEKVLGAEAKDDCSNYDSSARNSLVSNGRSSYGSTITLSGKPLEGVNESNVNVNGSGVCPLQGYLFGSGIELSETKAVVKKEQRTSLGELFQKSKLAEENFGAKSEKAEKRNEGEAYNNKSAMQLVKKKLKKRILHTVDPASAEKKLHKILHMFNRKVHPESSVAEQKCDKHQKNEKKNKKINDGGNRKSDVVHPEEYIEICPKGVLARESMQQYKNQSNRLQFTPDSEDSYENENGEHWIKTDADYLVLEL